MIRERVRNVRFYDKKNELCNALDVYRWVPDTHAIMIPWESRIVQSQDEVEAPSLWWVPRLHMRSRTEYRK